MEETGGKCKLACGSPDKRLTSCTFIYLIHLISIMIHVPRAGQVVVTTFGDSSMGIPAGVLQLDVYNGTWSWVLNNWFGAAFQWCDPMLDGPYRFGKQKEKRLDMQPAEGCQLPQVLGC